MTYDRSRRIGVFTLFSALLIAAFFFIAAPAQAAAADDAATAVFGPTIDNVPWQYIPDWYKTELIASGYSAPADPSMPPVVSSAVPESAVWGPTIANVPWEYVPAWYKAELAAAAAGGNAAPSQVAVLKDEAPSLNALTEVSEMVGKESADGSDVKGNSFERDQWGAQAAAGNPSFMSHTSFFFLSVLLIFLILMIVSALKQRSRTSESGG